MHTALQCLLMLAQWHRVRLSPQALVDSWAHSEQSARALVGLSQAHGMKARLVQQDWSRIKTAPLPAIAVLRDGSCCIVGRFAGDGSDSLLVQFCGQAPVMLGIDAFRQQASGEFIYLRARLSTLLPRRGDDSSVQGLFLASLSGSRGLISEILVICVALQCLALLTPLLFQLVTDKVLVNHAQATLQVVVVGLLLAGLFEVLFSGVRSAALARLSARVDIETGQRLMHHVLSLPMSYFASRRTGDTLARVREADHVRTFITGAGLNALLDFTFALLFMGVLLFYSAELTGLVVASVVAYALVSWLFSPLLLRRLDKRMSTGADNQAFLVESLTGAATVKTLALNTHCLHHWRLLLAASAKAALNYAHALLIAQGAVMLISRLVQVGLLAWGAQAVMDSRMTVGELLAFNMLAAQVSGPVLRLSQLWSDCQQLKVSLDRMNDIFSVPAESTEGGLIPDRLQGAITFDRVTFRYRVDLPDVLKEISFQLKPGEVLGIVGSSGSGKSTVVQALQGLYAVSGGRVRIDGHDVSMMDRLSLRSQIGVVMQDSFLFDRSIRDNIAIGVPLAPIERIVEAAKLAGAHDFIVNLPQGYDTPVGEQGRSLSGGQRQRIAIARALIKNPRILVFDEATSALDVESEFSIHHRMHEICANRTVIIIAHRLSAIRHAHRLLVLHQGRIVEQGSRQFLLEKKDGYFYRMHQLQLQGMV